jgi:uncharacterized protein
MNTHVTGLISAGLMLWLPVFPIQQAQAVSPDIVISQVYGGGGNSGATYTNDFIELFNRGTATVALAGWSVQYASSAGTIWQVTALSGSVAPGQYFLVQQAQGTSGTTPLPTPDATGSIATSASAGKVAVVNTSAALSGSAPVSASIVDVVGYGTADFFEGSGPAPTLSNTTADARAANGCADTDDNAVDFAAGAPTPRNSASPLNPCGTTTVKIHEVQGSAAASPLAGQTVTIEGTVVGDFQSNAASDDGDLRGFHIQEEDADADADPLTSEGIFVFDGSSPATDVALGDLVSVTGQVAEFNGMTEITSVTVVTVLSTGNTLPSVASLAMPVTAVSDFEAFEGMRVTFPQALFISEYFNFGRFNELLLSSARHLTPTAEFEPGTDALQAAQDILLDKITLDDGRNIQNPDPAIHPNGSVFDLNNLFRGGDTVQNATGVLDYSFGIYRIQPTQAANHVSLNPRTAQPDDVAGDLKVASFDTLNYFTTLDNGVDICGPATNQECRGADNPTEFTRQRDKILAALAGIDADVVGLISIENHPGNVPVADLVSGLNARLGAGTYDYIATGAIGADAIRAALIYKPATVTPVGSHAVLDATVDPRFNDVKNRPSLAQSFADAVTGGIFTVAVNHFKTKGSDCNDVGDPDTGDGSGNCNLTRKAAAKALVDWLATDPTGSGDGDFLIIGDLNAYDKEEPVDAIKAGADDTPGSTDDYSDMIFQFLGEEAYSFLFDGQLGYLDHALASTDLLDEVSGVTIWHINADEPSLIDYDMDFKQAAQDALYAPDAYRSSDHDPVVIGLDVRDEIAPTFDTVSVTPNVLWPANHKYVNVTATVAVSDDTDSSPTVTLVSVTSNEPDNGDDDGETVNDIVIVDDFHFRLRAERSGTGTGRTYTMTYQVIDACGNSTTASATVSVPLDLTR